MAAPLSLLSLFENINNAILIGINEDDVIVVSEVAIAAHRWDLIINGLGKRLDRYGPINFVAPYTACGACQRLPARWSRGSTLRAYE